MAKKKITKKKPTLALTDTVDLAADGDNPRTIDEKAAGGLRNSLKRFGDLSGIVWNKRSGELVCGHQRMSQVREEYGDQPVEVLDADSELGCIRIDSEHVFAVRVVDWSQAKQRAANVAANSQKISGEFTDELTDYILLAEADIEKEMPGVMDDVLLTEMLAEGMDLGDAEEDVSGQGVTGVYEVVVSCNDEEHQRAIYDKLKAEGHAVKVLTI